MAGDQLDKSWALYETQAEAEATAQALNAGKKPWTAFVQPPLAAWAGTEPQA